MVPSNLCDMRCWSLPGITVFHLLFITTLCGGDVARAEFGGYLRLVVHGLLTIILTILSFIKRG